MTLNDQLIQMQINLESARTHITDLEKGRKASSSKARSELMKVKKMSLDLRKQCIVAQKAIPVKSRVKVTPTVADVVPEAVPDVVPETPPPSLETPEVALKVKAKPRVKKSK